MADESDVEKDISPHKLLPGAPVRSRLLVGVVTDASNEKAEMKFDGVSEDEEHLAFKRRCIFERLQREEINRTEAIAELNVGESRFYTLYEQFRQSKDYTGMIRGKRGPKIGSTYTSEKMTAVLEEAFDKYRGPKASIMAVLRKAQQLCHEKNLGRPTKYQVSKFIKSKSERLLYTRKYGEEAAAQKFDHRPGFIEPSPEEANVQMDHTLVDILLVDEVDRSCIVGRPWLTVIICTLTRIIMGWYLSFRAPSVITVQLALLAAFLPKNSKYNPLKIDVNMHPFCGLPPECYTDNASEFVSQQLLLKCARYGMDWSHRPIGKKWYGGIIERVIGTFMTRSVHFLPGSTGSNPVERQFFESELNATMSMTEFCEWFACEVTKYHSRRHAALDCSPRIAWSELRGKGTPGELPGIGGDEELSFALDFMPSEYDLKVHNYGINFASRRYWGDVLVGRIGQKCEIRYDPNDLRTIWVLLDSVFFNIGCNRMRKGDSMNYESHTKHISILRHDVNRKVIPIGLNTDEFGLACEERSDAIVAQAIANTASNLNPHEDAIEELPSTPVDRVTDYALPMLQGSSVEVEIDDDDDDDLKPQILIDHEDY
ncbi:transposase [Pseudomonas sp. A014]|uniref:transposase n=1 Tax=Pseudomonas sp. A014 TaxID=3458058 RepID=UPI0040373D49